MNEQNPDVGINVTESVPPRYQGTGGPGAEFNFKPIIVVLAAAMVLALSYSVFAYFQRTWPFPEDKMESIFPFASPSASSSLPSTSGLPEGWIEVAWEKSLLDRPSVCEGKDEDCGIIINTYLVGKVISDNFKGEDLFLEEVQEMGSYFRHYVLRDGKKLYLERNGKNENIKIKGIDDLPEEISLPGMSYRLRRYDGLKPLFSSLKLKQRIFSNEALGEVYLTEDGCFVAERPDHLAIAYDLEIPFYNKENGLLTFTLNGGGINEESYSSVGKISCGALCKYLAIVTEESLNSAERLEIAGRTANGDILYKLKDQNDGKLRELYNDKNTMAYYDNNSGPLNQNKYTYQEFVNFNPFIYWKDPLGRWIEFEDSRFGRMAEICKPVIYLYPEKEARIYVKVSPNGGFTFTEPPYDNGWEVDARPDGKLRDARTGKQYDYLFWEGIGLDYPLENKGWVVKQADLSMFFDKKLEELGLNQKESADFKEYWVKRLSGKPYYRVSFLLGEQVDSLAPLELSLRPHFLLRVIMIAEGLNGPISIEPQKLPVVPSRSGFSVVEWGGALLK